MKKYDVINGITNILANCNDVVSMKKALIDLMFTIHDTMEETHIEYMPVQLTSTDLNTNRIGAIKFVKSFINGIDTTKEKRIQLQCLDYNDDNVPYNGEDIKAYFGLKASKDLADAFVDYLVTNYNNK